MKKILLLIMVFAFAQGVEAQSPEDGVWTNFTGQTFGDRITSLSVSPDNSLTASGEFNDNFGAYFTIYDSTTNEFVNTMPAPGIVTCQYFSNDTWYIGLEDAPFCAVWIRETQTWETFATNIDSTVSSICEYQNGLMLGGFFTNHLAFYNLDDFTTQLMPNLDANVLALGSVSDSLFIGMGSEAFNSLLVWNGFQYSAVDSLKFEAVGIILTHGESVYVSGLIYFNGSLQNRVMQFTQSTGWKELFITYPWATSSLYWDSSNEMLLFGPGSTFATVITANDTVDTTSPILGFKDDSIISFPDLFGTAVAITKLDGHVLIGGNFAENEGDQYKYRVYQLAATDTTTGGTNSVVVENLSGVTLFPNPATSYITVSGLPVQKTDLDIYDYLGRRVAHYVATQKATLNVSGLPTGMYVVRTPHGESRFIKQ